MNNYMLYLKQCFYQPLKLTRIAAKVHDDDVLVLKFDKKRRHFFVFGDNFLLGRKIKQRNTDHRDNYSKFIILHGKKRWGC